jgi:hypothetical protein
MMSASHGIKSVALTSNIAFCSPPTPFAQLPSSVRLASQGCRFHPPLAAQRTKPEGGGVSHTCFFSSRTTSFSSCTTVAPVKVDSCDIKPRSLPRWPVGFCIAYVLTDSRSESNSSAHPSSCIHAHQPDCVQSVSSLTSERSQHAIETFLASYSSPAAAPLLYHLLGAWAWGAAVSRKC